MSPKGRGEGEDGQTEGVGGEVEFEAPEGFEIPGGVKLGDTFESLATVELCEGGKLCLRAIDGVPVTSSESEEDKESEENEETDQINDNGGFLDAIEKRAAKESM